MVRVLVAGWLALCAGAMAPSAAAADGAPAQASFLARMMMELTTDQLLLDDRFLIRLPAVDEASVERPVDLAERPQDGVAALLGAGLDLSSASQEEGDIRVQLRPNLGRRGGLLRCIFRF